MPAARIVTVVLFLLLLASVAPSARAAPVLELPRAWFDIVEPYRYVEARRFEAGWNRGADALVPGHVARAPVGGRVRFAGSVVGRTVVTIDTEVGGEPAVVTITGLDSSGVRAGDRLHVGDVIGRGRYVHVGAYDPRRRSRYHPVRAAAADVPASAATATDRTGRSPVADHVAARLRDAILGTALPTGASTSLVAARAPVATPPDRDANRAPTPGARGRHAERAALAWPSTRLARPGLGRAAARAHAGEPLTGVAEAPAGRGPDRPARDRSQATSTTTLVRDGVDRLRPETSAPRPPVAPIDAVRSHAASSPASPRPHVGAETLRESATSTDPDPDPSTVAPAAGAQSSSAWSLPLVLLVALLPLAAFVRRRRRPARTRRSTMREPLPVVLPHVRPYAYPVVGHDGASMLSDIALAWPDRDPGMGHDTESPARVSREPEHA